MYSCWQVTCSTEPLSSLPSSSDLPSSFSSGCSDVSNTTDDLVVGLWPRTASVVSIPGAPNFSSFVVFVFYFAVV